MAVRPSAKRMVRDCGDWTTKEEVSRKRKKKNTLAE
jgi:hypothetical protein